MRDLSYSDVDAGMLNRRLQYQTITSRTKDATGQEQDVWTTQGTYWGFIRSPTSREALNAGQIKAEASHVLTVRYQGFDFTPLGRWLYKSRIFNICGVVNVDERNKKVEMLCTEVVSPNQQ